MDSKMQQAKEWAGIIRGEFNAGWPTEDHVNAAAEVIEALPDQWIDAEKVREIYDRYRANELNLHEAFRAAVALTTPPLPTLADMTPEERKACQWMQAKIHGLSDLVGVIFFLEHGRAKIMLRDGTFWTQDDDEVTPLPDLPRLKWPGSEQSTSEERRIEAWDEIVEHPFFTECFDGEKSLIEEMIDKLDSHMGDRPVADLPHPEDVPAGEAWIVEHEDREWIGCRNDPGTRLPWLVIGRDYHDFDYCYDVDITLVSRLVPEHKENA